MRAVTLRIGVIGYRNHAARLIRLVSQHPHADVAAVYHPQKRVDHPAATTEIEALYACDAVFVASPNPTHCGYVLDLLQHSRGPILCEKPPVMDETELKTLAALTPTEKGRIYFNFNYRFGLLRSILNNPAYTDKLGRLNYINIALTHGLAFKQDYPQSWRADGAKNLHAITETVAIHYIDVLGLHFGRVQSYRYHPMIVARTGTAYDTAHLSLQFDTLSASILARFS